jgi:predicted Holliday junction resolvase-like endonuclease
MTTQELMSALCLMQAILYLYLFKVYKKNKLFLNASRSRSDNLADMLESKDEEIKVKEKLIRQISLERNNMQKLKEEVEEEVEEQLKNKLDLSEEQNTLLTSEVNELI